MSRPRTQYFDGQRTPLFERFRSWWMEARAAVAWGIVAATLLALVTSNVPEWLLRRWAGLP